MSFNCNKCKRGFKSQYLLNKHTNRAFLCDTIFQCSECGQVFATNVILTQHKNRKTSCSSKEITDQIQLQIKQLSIKEQELRLEEQERKFNHEVKMDKIRKQQELKLNHEVGMIELKKQELQLEQQERKFKHEVEMVELRKQAFIEKQAYIKNIKADRKKMAIIINITTNNYKQYIYDNYKDNDDMSTLQQTMETGYQNMISDKSGKIMLHLYNERNNDKQEQLVNNIFAYCFSNPTSQCLFYNKELVKFYGIYRELEVNMVKEVEFYDKLLPILAECIVKFIDYMDENHKCYYEFSKKSYPINDLEIHCELAKLLYHDDLRKFSAIFFEKAYKKM
jgi:hypothetical protein